MRNTCAVDTKKMQKRSGKTICKNAEFCLQNKDNRFTSKAHANAFDLFVGVTNTDILLLKTLFYSSHEQWTDCLTSHTHVIQQAIRQCLGEQRTGKWSPCSQR